MMNAYLYQNVNDIINKSSSGGAFSKIVAVSIEEGLVVYGAAWDENLCVKHTRIIVNSIDDISPLRGSKYVRSDMGDMFSSVRNDLIQGHRVIFSGTACQVAGLLNFLRVAKTNINRLLTVDIICHGTVLTKIFLKYIEWIECKYKRKVISIDFRDKKIGWHGYPTTITFDDGRKISHTYDTQLFKRIFFSHLALAPSCYECRYSSMDRFSDITIGDFWGMHEEFSDISEKKGASLILANTLIGKTIANEINNKLSMHEVMAEVKTTKYLKYQHNLRHPTCKPINADDFLEELSNDDFLLVVRKYGLYSNWEKTKFFLKKCLKYCGIYRRNF